MKARADLGGAIAGRHIWGELVSKMGGQAGAERILVPIEVVLAIDVTGSMNSSIDMSERGLFPEANRRINIVRTAAKSLVDALYPRDGETSHVSVGLVPFNTTVNIGSGRTSWVNDLGQGHKIIPAGFGSWRGCIEHRVMTDDLDLSLELPADSPFTSWFSPSTLEYRPTMRQDLEAAIQDTVTGENDWDASSPHMNYAPSPHQGCPGDEIIPLTTDRDTVDRALDRLQVWTGGGGTMAHLGAVWGRRLLAPEWRGAWGLLAQDDDPNKKRVLVLLTDGVNNAYDDPGTYPGHFRYRDRDRRTDYGSGYTGYGRSGTGAADEGYLTERRLTGVTSNRDELTTLDDILIQACDLAKDDGITVFTVSAVPAGHPKETHLADQLVACASSETHAFIQNNDAAAMEEAFREIGQLIQGIRKI